MMMNHREMLSPLLRSKNDLFVLYTLKTGFLPNQLADNCYFHIHVHVYS